MLTFKEFDKKYPTNYGEGFKPSKTTLEELVKDYESLPPKERFVAFEHFRSEHESEVLKAITSCAAPAGLATGLFYERIDTFKKVLLNNLKNKAGDWDVRTELAEGLFCIGEQLKVIDKNYLDKGRSATELEKLHHRVYDKLAAIYLATTDTPTGNKYWDTDNDFIPQEGGLYEYYFDYKDSRPFDPRRSVEEPEKPIDLKIGEKISSPIGEIVKIGKDKYEIVLKIHLEADKTVPKRLAKRLNDPKYLEQLQKEVNKFYKAHREEGLENRDLNVQFVTDPKDAWIVQVTESRGNIRPNSAVWQTKTLRQPSMMLHESLHLLGLEDLYHEYFVDDGQRDHTLQPGFELIDKFNIMCNSFAPKTILRGWQVRDIMEEILRTGQKISPQKTATVEEELMMFYESAVLAVQNFIDECKPEEKVPVDNLKIDPDVIYKSLEYYSIVRRFVGIDGFVDEALRKSPNDYNLQTYQAIIYFERGDIKSGMKIYDNFLHGHGRGSRSHVPAIIRHLVRTKNIKLAEEVIFSFEEARETNKYNLLKILYEEGEYDRALFYIENDLNEIEQGNDVEDLWFFDMYLDILKKTKKSGRVASILKVVLSRNPYDLILHCKIIQAYLDAGDFKEAALWVKNTREVIKNIEQSHLLKPEIPEEWDSLSQDPRIKL